MTRIQEPRLARERDFLVYLTVKPGTRLPDDGRLQLNFPGDTGEVTSVVIKNLVEVDLSRTPVPVGLRMDVKVKAHNIDQAVTRAISIADGVVSFISFCTGVGLPIVREELAYDISSEISDRDFLQFFHDLPVRVSRRQLQPAAMIDLMDRVFKLHNTETRNRILRAIRYCRKGSLATDPLEKFTWYWFGLETLNPALQESLKMPDALTRCPNCGHEWVSTPTVSGIRAAVQKLVPDGTKLYKRMRELRVSLFHGKSDLKTLIAQAIALESKARETLVRSVFLILGASPTERFLSDTLSVHAPAVAALEATMQASDPSNLGPPSEHPHFELGSHAIQAARPSERGISLTVSTSLITRVGQGVVVRCHGWRLYGQEVTLDRVEAT